MNNHGEDRRHPFQFRLRAFFLAAIVLAIALAGLTAENERLRLYSVGVVSLAPQIAAAVGAARGRGYFQTFCIGVLVPAIVPGSLLSFFTDDLAWDDRSTLPLLLFKTLFLYAACGLFAVFLHWALRPRDKGNPGGTVDENLQ